METYKLNDNSKLMLFDGLNLLGNAKSGSLLKLNEDGLEFVKKLINGCLLEYDSLSQLEKELINALQKYGFINDNNLDKLNSAYFHITDRCNLKCLGCYSYINYRNSYKDIDLDDAIKIIDNLKRNGVNNITISGGEPFLHKNIIDILKYAKNEAKISNLICITNGTADTEKYLEAGQYLNDLSFSIDGYSPESCLIRESKLFNIIDNKIDYLKDKMKVSLIYTLHKKNLNDSKKFIEYANKKSVFFNFSILTILKDDMKNLEDLFFKESDYEELSDVLLDYEITDTLLKKQLSCKKSCGAGKTMISILADGSIMPCHMFFDKKFSIGNALEDDIANVIHSKCNILNNITVDDMDDCVKCEYKYLCGGGCRFRAYAYSNTVKGKDALCSSYKKNFSNLLNLIK